MRVHENAAAPSQGYNVFLFAQIQDILDGFRAGGVDVIVLKGAALAETVYGHIGLRPMCDIDILVKPEHSRTAGVLLSDLGYRPAPNNPSAYIKPGPLPAMVDVHTGLAHLDRDETIRVWREAREATVAGVSTRVLSCEDTLVHIISHMSCSHGVVLEKWLRDIDRVVRHYQTIIAWEAVVARLDRCRLVAPARYLLERAARELGTPVAPWVHDALKAKDKNCLRLFFFRLVLAQKGPPAYLDYLLPVLTTEGLLNKCKLILQRLFPSRELIQNRFGISHPALVPLCYAARILVLLAKACAGLIELLRRAITLPVSLKTTSIIKKNECLNARLGGLRETAEAN